MRTLLFFLLLLIFSASSALAQGGNLLHSYEIGVDVEVSTTITVYDSDGAVVYPAFTIQPGGTGADWTADVFAAGTGGTDCAQCDWHADWDVLNTDFLTIRISADQTRYYVWVPSGPVFVESFSFLSPGPWTGSPDINFFVFEENGFSKVQADAGSGRYEDVFGTNYVMPYDQDYYCAVAGCTPSHNEMFLASVNSVAEATARQFTFGDIGSPVIQPTWTPTWDTPGLTLKFHARSQLIAEGRLEMDGVTLTEAVTDEGWWGVRYEPDGGGFLRGVTIEKFGHNYSGGGLFAPAVYGLTVNDRWLAVYRSTIRGGHHGASGVWSTGDEAQISFREENGIPTIIEDNEGVGLYASNQGRIFLRGSDVLANFGNGGTASGTGSTIYANEASTISDNLGVGLEAKYDGNIYLYNPNTPTAITETIIDGNIGGGLLARFQGSYINAGKFSYGGSAQGTCLAACQNFITGHPDVGAPFEVKATSGSVFFAEFDHWGFGRTQESDLDLDEEVGSMIEVLPIWDGVSSFHDGPVALKGGNESSSFGETVRDFIITAFDQATAGRWTPALAHAQAAVALASSEDELSMVMGAVSALVGHEDAPEMPSGLLIAIEAHLGSGEQGRPYAMRSLLSAHRMRGRDTDARSMALALAADYPRTEHALVGLSQEVEIALVAGDVPAAQAALATMEADFPDESLTESTRAYFVLLEGEEALPARAPATHYVASAAASNASQGAMGGFALHAAYPNPSNPQAVVPFSVAEAAHVQIVVFDMLGREVAALADGRYEVGIYETVFDGSALPSGMYLVRANVAPENGGSSSAFTQRITLLK